jgi:hypothetical protein
MTTKLIRRGNLGMDHQAIVWCHGVLSVVRKLIWVLSVAEDLPIKERRHRSKLQLLGGFGSTASNSPNYSDIVQEVQARSQVSLFICCRRILIGVVTSLSFFQLETASCFGCLDCFQAHFGYWKMVCMEAAMLYNLPLLVALFGVIGSFHCAAAPILPRQFSLIVPVVACGCGWLWSDVNAYSVVLLTLVANTVHACLAFGIGLVRRILGRSRQKTTSNSWWRPLLLACGGTFVLALLLGAAVTQNRRNDGTWSFPPLDIVFYACSVVLIYASVLLQDAEASQDQTQFSVYAIGHNPTDAYAAVVVLVIPFLIAGQVVLMAWEGATRASTWYFLLKTGVPITMASVIARWPFVMGTTSRHHRVWQVARSIVLSASILCCCPCVLPRGTGFRLATILILIAWTDIFFSLFTLQVTSTKNGRQK